MHSTAFHDVEDQLREAMLASDVEALDRLLSDALVFTNHLGQRMTKADDLGAHRTGFVRIDSIAEHSRDVVVNDHLGIVSAHVTIQGRFGGQPSAVSLRFTRIWVQEDAGITLVAAHSSQVIP